MDIIGLGKPRADSWLRKFRTRGVRPSEDLCLCKGVFWEAPQDHILASYRRWKNFGVQYGSD